MQPTQALDPKTDLYKAITGAASYLLQQLDCKSQRARTKYEYYDADNDITDFGISVPKKMMNSKPGIGWASRAVNTLSDRLNFDGFAGDESGINDLFERIGASPVINAARHDSIIAGCAFIAIADDGGGKKLIPFTALEATGVIDENTGLLSMGLAVTRWSLPNPRKRNYLAVPVDYILFLPEFTAVFQDDTLCDIKENPTKRCLLHPITRKRSANAPLGRSKLTKSARRIIQEVARVKRRYEIASEFYSTPQRYINGLAQGAEKDNNLDSALGKVWAVTKDDDGDKPDIGQLAQMSIDQFSGQKKDLARDFCAETSLTLRNLGYETANPTSADSLTAMSDDLLLEAKSLQREMGEQIKQIAITLRMSIDGIDTVPDKLKKIVPAWSPIFQVDLGAAGDAVYKLFQAMPELIGTVQSYQMLGISVREAEQLQKIRQSSINSQFMQGGAK
jgi:phage portal protein, SPP1 gp6-like|nr:MAG TPA: PORTAL PROTEIN [Bacteriophage sp.]